MTSLKTLLDPQIRRKAKLAAILRARQICLATNNPEPLIRKQWPGVVIDDFQRDLLRSMFDPGIREVYVKGCTASGKTASVGLGVCVYFDVFEDARIVLTSSTFQHVNAVLFAEVARWFAAMAVPTVGAKLLATGISHHEGHYVDCVNPSNGESFSGRHGRHTLFVADEATALPDERYQLIDTQASKFVALANPRTLSGRFRLAFGPCRDPNQNETVLGSYGYRRCLTIDGKDVLNVRQKRLENPVGPIGGIEIQGRDFRQGEPIPEDVYEHVKPLIPGQLCLDTYRGHLANPDRRWADTFARGRFPDEDPKIQVILTGWLDRHIAAHQRSVPSVTCFGLDPADSEFGDETVLAAGGPAGCAQLHTRRRQGTMDTCAWVLRTAEQEHGVDLRLGKVPIVIDADGLGKGIADRLLELGARVILHRGNGTPTDRKRHANRRAEAYSILGDRLNPDGAWGASPWGLPDDSLLRQDLAAPEKVYGSDGLCYKLTPKTRQPGMPTSQATLAEKLGRSPDRGDAVVLLYWAVNMGENMMPRGIPRADVDRAMTLKAAEPVPNDTASVIVAVHQNPAGKVAMAAFGVRLGDHARLRLLRCEALGDDLGTDAKAAAITQACTYLQASGVAYDAEQIQWLAGSLNRAGIAWYHSPLNAERRHWMAADLMYRLREGAVEMARDEELAREIARLPISDSATGYNLDDDDSLALLGRGVSFALALHWAAGTLRDYLSDYEQHGG